MTVIDEYTARFDNPERTELERIRQLVLEVTPDAQEVISYGMPGFKYKGKYLCGFNAFKHHLSFFPTSAPVDTYRDRLEGYTLSKGTVRFTLEHPLSGQLIPDMCRHRAQVIDNE